MLMAGSVVFIGSIIWPRSKVENSLRGYTKCEIYLNNPHDRYLLLPIIYFPCFLYLFFLKIFPRNLFLPARKISLLIQWTIFSESMDKTIVLYSHVLETYFGTDEKISRDSAVETTQLIVESVGLVTVIRLDSEIRLVIVWRGFLKSLTFGERFWITERFWTTGSRPARNT